MKFLFFSLFLSQVSTCLQALTTQKNAVWSDDQLGNLSDGNRTKVQAAAKKALNNALLKYHKHFDRHPALPIWQGVNISKSNKNFFFPQDVAASIPMGPAQMGKPF